MNKYVWAKVVALAVIVGGVAEVAFADDPECEWMASRKITPGGVIFRDDGQCPPLPCTVGGEAYVCDDVIVIIGTNWRGCQCGGEEEICTLIFNGADFGIGAVSCRNNGCPNPCLLVASGAEVNGWRKVDCRCPS